MSGALLGSAITAGIQAGSLTDFFAGLLGASYRGAPFLIAAYDATDGRRIGVHEYPLRDRGYTEDLGRRLSTYRVRAYVAGPLYSFARDALRGACADESTPGVLIHPYLGRLSVRCQTCHLAEDKERLGYAAFELTFIDEGDQPSPTSLLDSAGDWLAKAGALYSALAPAVSTIIHVGIGAYLGDAWRGLLAGAASQLLGLPLMSTLGLEAMASGITETLGLLVPVVATAATIEAALIGAPLDLVTSAGAFTGALAGYADAVVSAAEDDSLGPELTGGLAALAAWARAQNAASTGLPTVVAGNQVALAQLIGGGATAAIAAIFAQIDWPDAQAAADGLDQLLALIDDQVALAADSDQAELYAAWQDLQAAAITDMRARAQSLPSLAVYAMPDVMPAFVLSQRLYQTAAQADALAALNRIAHPLFMPATGKYLRA
jgi:hypothetical protein